MSDAEVRLTIDGREVRVPAGTLIVDAAKRVGIDIPVFCYHPKLEPVGMCRMCLVEIGRPARDRGTGQPLLDEQGQPVMQFGPKLETACTTPVGEGWQVRVASQKAVEGRKEIVEFLLTSHPLDCPICDKGGECPLQNQTMEHGPGRSRFLYDDKIHLDKRVPLGDLILLDRERCIQCARCIRFQEELAGDPVLGFYERGRKLEIITFSEPGFDSYFSGNTTDICPVGALTTTDFRFGARPWELNAAASICPHCAVGCNLTLNTRREAAAGGGEVIKRVMPRQNEAVNEVWICDKGRFAHHYAASPERLRAPLVRKGEALVEASWQEAIQAAADGLRASGSAVLGLAGGRLSNEDLAAVRTTVQTVGGDVRLDTTMAGGEWVRQFGLGPEADLGKLGPRDAVLVIASDLHEEAPIWWLRLRNAARRGVRVVSANARATRLDDFASEQVRYDTGAAVESLLAMGRAAAGEGGGRGDLSEAAKATGQVLAQADELVVFFGSEGLDLAASDSLAQACAALLVKTGHAGKTHSGLVGVWPRANAQGAWEMGWAADPDGPRGALTRAKAAYVVASDPLGDDPDLEGAIEALDFLVVQDLFLTKTAERADVVLPAQSFIEREGSLTSGERRVQRYYPAIPALGESLPDWRIATSLGEALGATGLPQHPAGWLDRIAGEHSAFEGITYQALAEVHEQWPLVGGGDLYFGGTSYANRQGLGVALPRAQESPPSEVTWPAATPPVDGEGLLLVPVHRLYDQGTTLAASRVLDARRTPLLLAVSPEDAGALGAVDGASVNLAWDGRSARCTVVLHPGVRPGSALIPRSSGIPLAYPVRVRIEPVAEEARP